MKMRPTTKRMTKLNIHPKIDSSVLNSTRESIASKRSKTKNKKIASTRANEFVKPVNYGYRS